MRRSENTVKNNTRNSNLLNIYISAWYINYVVIHFLEIILTLLFLLPVLKLDINYPPTNRELV
jgi:hypothetical protein